MATPNEEQKLAIEHQGGVLLKAGAGSGKTFVLKEHIVFLLRKWISEYQNEMTLDFDTYIRSCLRRVVLMTFTKKAAGELEIRIKNELNDIALSADSESEYWNKILDNLSYLTISTIHGFCFKLIKQGFFPGVSADQDIIEESKFKDILTELFTLWLEQEENQKLDIYPLIVKEKNQVLAAMISIFSDPTLRCAWEDVDEKHMNLETGDSTIKELITLNDWGELWGEGIDVLGYSEFKGKKWYDFLEKFLVEFQSVKPDLAGLIKLNDFFLASEFKIPVKPSIKTVPAEVVAYYELVKSLKDYLKKNGEHFKKFHSHFDSNIVPWFQMIKGLITFIGERYAHIPGVTFGDLEYLVFRGLEHKKIAELVGEQYDYFIVDEFQDTSYIQFSMIEKIIDGDFNKLFCVGDLKQAIYGFRGGELGVFLDCEKKIPLNLTLNNNYRSDSSIIDFNNHFFDFLFAKGINYQGHDPGGVTVDHQTVPPTTKELGSINELNCSLDFRQGSDKLSNLEVDYIEALTIMTQIKENKENRTETAILYKKLKPSLILIDLLINESIGFTAQIKIPFLEDPLLGMFNCLLEYGFDSNENKDKYLLYSFKSYLSLLGQPRVESLTLDLFDEFYNNRKYFGTYHAFCDMLERLGVKNSNYKNNIKQIHLMINSAQEDSERLLKLMKVQRDLSYSLDFQYGHSPEQVKIMTAHSSKGLQFKNVILGGMYTNENTFSLKSFIGKYPLSFKWSDTIHGKNRYKTPHYLLEEMIIKAKDFSESKRLFYVANTRAEQSLSYVNIKFDELKRVKSSAGSWINGLYKWFDEEKRLDYINCTESKIADSYSTQYLELADLKPPLFHVDNIGLLCVEPSKELVYLPELAITKLTSLAQCPRKFYLQNICKISDDELSLLSGLGEESDSVTLFRLPGTHTGKMNAAERGTLIHAEIAKQVEDSFTTAFIHNEKTVQTPVNWAVENLKKYLDNFKFVSEKPIKFELLNYMISGIPDLILLPDDNNGVVEIWDFKTGKYSEEKLRPYYFQLMCYAYAQYYLATTAKEKEIKLVLLFVDTEKKVEKNVSYIDVENYLIKTLENLHHPWLENTDECEHCLYKNICQK